MDAWLEVLTEHWDELSDARRRQAATRAAGCVRRLRDELSGDPGPGPARVLDRLAVGVVVFEAGTHRCRYRNEYGSRWHDPGAPASTDASPPAWSQAYLDTVERRLAGGPLTEPLPPTPESGSPPAQVDWQLVDGHLVAVIRELSAAEEARRTLDELDPEARAEAAPRPRPVDLTALCRRTVEQAAGDVSPVAAEVPDEPISTLGDPELLGAALHQLVAWAVATGPPGRPVLLRLRRTPGYVQIEVDRDRHEPTTAGGSAAVDTEELHLVRLLTHAHGGRLHLEGDGRVRRARLAIPSGPDHR